MSETPLTFVTVAAELRALGITLESRPGEYRVNFHSGSESTACYTDDLEGALAAGRELAATTPVDKADQKTPNATGKRRRPPRRMTPKAQRRRMIRQHNRRMRALTIQEKK
jgi:hypothetical protein